MRGEVNGVAKDVLVPFVVSTWPAVDCVGRSALSAAVAVVCPVPPLAIGRVPETSLVKTTAVFELKADPVEVTKPAAGAEVKAVPPFAIGKVPEISVPSAIADLLPKADPVEVTNPVAIDVAPVPPEPIGSVPVTSALAILIAVCEVSAVPDDFTKPDAGSEVDPVPPFATGSVPETSVLRAIEDCEVN